LKPQWVDPDVETTQLSGKPPAWYRSNMSGPRIFVFEKGRLIDDTAIEVSDKVRQRMRQEAFILVEEDRQKVKEKMAKAEEMKRKLTEKSTDEKIEREANKEAEDESSTLELITDALFPKEEKEEGRGSDNEKSLDELKKIIADWEASQNEDAKKALE
jgi:hypothetical protein